MKRVQMMLLAIFFSLACSANGNAGNRAVNGLLIGAGSGAIIGSAAGQNTESVLIGTAIGGAVGYAIGNSMGRPSHVVYHDDRRRPEVIHYQEHRPRGYSHHRDNHHYDKKYAPRHYREERDDYCRETITYKEKRRKVKRIVETTCYKPKHHDRHYKRSRWYR